MEAPSGPKQLIIFGLINDVRAAAIDFGRRRCEQWRDLPIRPLGERPAWCPPPPRIPTWPCAYASLDGRVTMLPIIMRFLALMDFVYGYTVAGALEADSSRDCCDGHGLCFGRSGALASV